MGSEVDTEPKKRVRRTKEEAQRVILDAAEERLAKGGPEALRLQDIAADVGISHPAILHHFESRDGLVLALAIRTLTNLRGGLLELLDKIDPTAPDAGEIVSEVFSTLSDRGLARLLAWVVLSGRMPDVPAGTADEFLMRDISDAIHDLRVRASEEHGMPASTKEDTMNVVFLAASAAFGDAVFGSSLLDSFGVEDKVAMRKNFRTWFARMLEIHLLSGGMPDDYEGGSLLAPLTDALKD